MAQAFAATTGWRLEPQTWTTGEEKLTTELMEKYASPAWNERR
jgi:hypothetical protein